MRGQIITSLNILKQLLIEHHIIKHTSGFESALGSVYKSRGDYWSYELVVNFLNVDSFYLGKMLPKIEVGDKGNSTVSIELVVNINETIPTDSSITDNIDELSVVFKIDLEGYLIGTENVVSARAGWHLDKDIFDYETAKKGEDQAHYHPLYHMHFGGYYLTEETSLYDSKIAVFEAPRLIHPPLDGVLAVDFVLRNFYSNTEQIGDLLQDVDYIRIVQDSRERLWKPYFMGLAANWHKFQGVEINPLYSKKLLDNSKYYIERK